MRAAVKRAAAYLLAQAGRGESKMTLVSPEKLFAEFDAKPPADPASVARCQSDLKFQLPAEFVQFLEQMNGGEGFVGENYLRVWPVEDLIEHNKGYNVEEFVPELFLFGSNGGGEAFAFDTRSAPPAIVVVPFIVLNLEDTIMIAPNFNAFLQHLYRSE
jgi:SMI1 / KNR4 family (SUKH-1)